MGTETGRNAVAVGVGIGGLAAAIGLRLAGWLVTVLERCSAASEICAGLSLFSNALSGLQALNVAQATRAHSTMSEGSGLRTPQGSWLFRVGALSGSASWVGTVAVDRGLSLARICAVARRSG